MEERENIEWYKLYLEYIDRINEMKEVEKMANMKAIEKQLIEAQKREIERKKEKKGYASPEEMMATFKGQHEGIDKYLQNEDVWKDTISTWDLSGSRVYDEELSRQFSPKIQEKESDQTPRAWNLVTLQRCRVTQRELYVYRTIEAVLHAKGFPTHVPDDGTLLVSWFDMSDKCAYYELCRVQDKKEMARYIQEKFGPALPNDEDERMVSL